MKIDRFDPAKTAMIVVDMQNDFVAGGAPMETPDARRIVPRLSEALDLCRGAGVKVIYTAHYHRPDLTDIGRFKEVCPPVAEGRALVDGTSGIEIYPALAPEPGEIVVKKHRYSAFFGTDLNLILRGWGIERVIISGTTTENCCLSTARDAMFNDYKVVFLSDATGTYDYPDRGYGAMPSQKVHEATLVILAASTAEVMTVDDLAIRLRGVETSPYLLASELA